METDLAKLACERLGIPKLQGLTTSQKVRYKWFALGQRRCAYCCRQLTWECSKKATKRTATVEHMVLKSRGGTKVFKNTLVVCLECNAKRGSRDFQEFVKGLPREDWLLSKYQLAQQKG